MTEKPMCVVCGKKEAFLFSRCVECLKVYEKATKTASVLAALLLWHPTPAVADDTAPISERQMVRTETCDAVVAEITKRENRGQEIGPIERGFYQQCMEMIFRRESDGFRRNQD